MLSMNKKMFRSISTYTLGVVMAVMVLTVSAAILSAHTPSNKQTQTLTTSSTSDLKVQSAASVGVPSVSSGGAGNASSSGTVTLQAGQAAPVPAGTAYPCASCPEAASATDAMICGDYCSDPEPTPVPPAGPYPACNACRGNTYGTSDNMIMCPMIACHYVQ